MLDSFKVIVLVNITTVLESTHVLDCYCTHVQAQGKHPVYKIMLLTNYRAVRKENNLIRVLKISFAFLYAEL